MQTSRLRKVEHRNDWLIDFFAGEDVFIIGGGPSLIGFDFSRLKGRRTIAINNAIQDIPNPEILLFVDRRFVLDDLPELGIDPYNVPFKILAGYSTLLNKQHPVYIFHEASGPSSHPGNLFSPTHSGSAAINAALIGGAARIFLLGFDMKFQGDLSHYHSLRKPHRHDNRAKFESRYSKSKIGIYQEYYRYKNIFNLSPDSALTGFQKLSIDEVL